MPSIIRTVFALLPIAVLAVLLGTPFTSQQALAKPMPVSRTIRSSGSGLITRNVKTLRYATASRNPPPAGGQAITNPPNGQRSQSRSAKSHTPNSRASKGRSPKGKTTKGQPPNGQAMNAQPSNAHLQSGPPSGGQSQAAAPPPTTGTKTFEGTQRAPQSGSQSTEQQMAVLEQQQQGAAESAAQFPSYSAEFHSHVLAAQNTLSELAAGKGLANFDAKAQLEVIVKEIANLIKEVLSDVTALIGKLPIVGPLLEPLVFQIKCVVVDLIDASENFLDGVLNILAPIVDPLLPGIV